MPGMLTPIPKAVVANTARQIPPALKKVSIILFVDDAVACYDGTSLSAYFHFDALLLRNNKQMCQAPT